MFVRTKDRIVNLKNVCNINIIEDKHRIIFNMSYGIQLPSKTVSSKIISDYVYWDSKSTEEFNSNMNELYNNDYFDINFISSSDENCFINIEEISSIKFIPHKYRVIFNMAHPITFLDYNKNERVTSEFVYANCTAETYDDYVKFVIENTGAE